MGYLARYGKVWKDKRTGEVHGNDLDLKDDDKIEHYTQVKEIKKENNKKEIVKKEDHKKSSTREPKIDFGTV